MTTRKKCFRCGIPARYVDIGGVFESCTGCYSLVVRTVCTRQDLLARAEAEQLQLSVFAIPAATVSAIQAALTKYQPRSATMISAFRTLYSSVRLPDYLWDYPFEPILKTSSDA